MKRKHIVGTENARAEAMGAMCSLCPLRDTSACVFGDGPAQFDIAIVGEGPGGNEVKVGKPFVGQSGSELESLLTKVGLRRSEIFITNATLHFPPGGDLENFEKRKKKEAKEAKEDFHSSVDCCRPRLFSELHIRKCRKCDKYEAGPAEIRCSCVSPVFTQEGQPPPKVIIPMGNFAMKALVGFDGISNWRGSLINMDLLRAVGSVFAPVKPLSSEEFLQRMRRESPELEAVSRG